MRASTWLIGAASCVTLIGFSEAAAAQEKLRQPLAQAERPLTVPEMTLAPEVALDFQNTSLNFTGDLSGASGNQFDFMTELGAAFGITPDLEVHADLAPVKWTNGVDYSREAAPLTGDGLLLGATYRFLKGDIEVGGRLDFSLWFVNGDNANKFEVTPGIPVRFHLGKEARLDTGLFVPVSIVQGVPVFAGLDIGVTGPGFESSTKPYVGMRIPVSFLYDITEPIHVAVNTAFATNFYDFGHELYVPLGFEAGYAVAGSQGPLVDIDPFFEWPAFVNGAGDPVSAIQAGLFVAGVRARGYLYL